MMTGLETVRILLVEDNPGDALLVRTTLKDPGTSGFEVTNAERLGKALELLAREDFDVVLLDLSLPDSQGLDTVERVRERAPRMPVVVLSGLGNEEVAIQALQSGAQDYLLKGQGDGNLIARSMRHAIERKRMEDALRESEERFRTVVESLGEGLLITDPENAVLYANPRMEELTGYAGEEMLGRPAYELLLPPEQWREALDRNEERLRGSSDWYEVQLLRKDGSALWTGIQATPYRNGAGEIVGSLRAITDITERKRFEAALKESEEKFRSLVQYASDIITILETDGTIRYESPAVERVLGYQPEDLVGTNAFDHVHPEDLEQVSSVFAQGLKSPGANKAVEFRFRHADGSWCYLEGIGNSLENHGAGGIVVNSRDVTERKRTEERLRRSLDALLALHEAGRALGSTLESEKIGRKLLEIVQQVAGPAAASLELVDEDGNSRILGAIGPEETRSRAAGTSESREARRAVLNKGEYRLFRLPSDSAPMPGVGLFLPLQVRNRVAGVLGVYGSETLSERASVALLGGLVAQAASALENARLYGELSEREQRLENLVGRLIEAQEEERRRIAYELHDGLTQLVVAVHQHLQAFARYHPPEAPEARKDLDLILRLIQRSVKESRQVIADLRPTVLDDFGLVAAIRSRIEELREEEWHIEYDVSLEDNRLSSSTETALYRVFQEAMTNVRKHARLARTRVSLGCVGGKVRLEVRDWGRRFDTASPVTANGPGERVGISSMRERITLLGGEFQIRSRPGEGTSIIVEVPVGSSEREESERVS